MRNVTFDGRVGVDLSAAPAHLPTTIAAIDLANGADPARHEGTPLALTQGRRASSWLTQLEPAASQELQLAVRGHHLRRWEIPRSDFPPGRSSYLRWRRTNKAHQADCLAELMEADGWPHASIERTRVLLERKTLRQDQEVQLLEDAACLVFLETQFDDMAERLDHDHLVTVVAKTLRKMSATAVTLAGSIGLSAKAQSILSDAVVLLETEETNER